MVLVLSFEVLHILHLWLVYDTSSFTAMFFYTATLFLQTEIINNKPKYVLW